MKFIVQEIRQALRAGLIYLAVTSSLTLPDICAAVESANGKTTGKLYKAWSDKWLATTVLVKLTSDDLYALRCGVIHEGKFGHPNLTYSRIIFTVSAPRIHNVDISMGLASAFWGPDVSEERPFGGNPLILDAGMFCSEMINGVLQWHAENMEKPHVKANLEKLLQLRPNGFPPYTMGFPVVS